jgi:hypothetical protein
MVVAKIDAGSRILPIEVALNNPAGFEKAIELIAESYSKSGCRCIIVDYPFPVYARIEEQNHMHVLSYVVGVGSIVCSPGCNITSLRDAGVKLLETTAPGWGYGRLIGGKSICRGLVGDLLKDIMALFGIGIDDQNLDVGEILRRSHRPQQESVVIELPQAPLDDGKLRLFIERRGTICGVLATENPLHPLGIFGKPGFSTCAREVYEVVGTIGQIHEVILYADSTPLALKRHSLGEVFIIGYDVAKSDHLLRVASKLGALYECGKEL